MGTILPFPRRALPTGLRLVQESPIERMIQLQMDAYPSHWTDQERREMAMQHLGLGDDPTPPAAA